MLKFDDYKTLTGYEVEKKSERELLAAIGTKMKQETSAAIATALLSHYLIDVRNYKVSEAAEALEVTAGYMSLAATRGQVLHLAATDTTAHTVWAQVRALSAKETQDMAATLTAKKDTERGEVLREEVTRKEISRRLGDESTPEKVDTIAQVIADAGHVTPKAIRKAIPSVATENGITLPEPTRPGATNNANDSKAAKVPTPAEALSMLEKFEQDREDGSDALAPFALDDKEAGDLVALAGVAARILRRAQRVEQVVEVAAITADTVEMMTEKV